MQYMDEKDIQTSGNRGLPSTEETVKELVKFSYEKGEKFGQFLSDIIDEIFK